LIWQWFSYSESLQVTSQPGEVHQDGCGGGMPGQAMQDMAKIAQKYKGVCSFKSYPYPKSAPYAQTPKPSCTVLLPEAMLEKDNYYELDLAGKTEDQTKEEIKQALFEHGPLQIGGPILDKNWMHYKGGYNFFSTNSCYLRSILDDCSWVLLFF